MPLYSRFKALCVVTLGLVLAGGIGASYGANTHGFNDIQKELEAFQADGQGPFVVQGCTHSTSVSTSASVTSCDAYVSTQTTPNRSVYVRQANAATINYSGGDGTYYLAVHESQTAAVGGWTRVALSHYIFQKQAGAPVTPAGALIVLKVTVSGGQITVVDQLFRRSPSFDNVVYAAQFGVVCDGVTDNTAALAAAVAAIPGDEGVVMLPGTSLSPCVFASTVTFGTKVINLRGQGGSRVGGTTPKGTRLLYTGTGPFLHLNTTSQNGSILEGFAIDNSNAGATFGILIDDAIGVVIRDVSIALPGVQFATAGLGVGVNADMHTFTMYSSIIRESAPIGVLANEVIGVFINDSTIQHHSVANIKVGDTAEANEVRLFWSRLEVSEVGNTSSVGIWIHNVTDLYVTECHFEVGQGADAAIRMPSTAVKCTNCVFTGNRITVLATGVVPDDSVVLDAPAPSGNPTFYGGFYNNSFKDNRVSPGAAITVQNTSGSGGAGWLEVTGNQITSHTQVVNEIQNVSGYFNSQNNHTIGGTPLVGNGNAPVIVCAAGVSLQNSGASETDLAQCTIPGSFIREQDNSGFRATVAGRLNTNANAKRVRVYFDGNVVWDSGSVVANGSAWQVECIGFRSSTTGIRINCQGNVPEATVAATGNVITARTAVTVGSFGSAKVFKTTGLGVATGDVVQEQHVVELFQ